MIEEEGAPGRPRRPSLKGTIMVDVAQGVERVRLWPRKRPGPKTKAQADQIEWFRQAQWATKYWPAQIQADIAEAVKGTPLLPRDIMTMIMANRLFMFVMQDGRKIYPMAARHDVSESLDVLSQIKGSILVRGDDFWQALLPGLAGEVLTSTGEVTPPNWQPLGSLAPLYERLRIVPDLSNFTLQNPGAGATLAVASATPYGVRLDTPATTTNVRFLKWSPALPAAPYSVILRQAPMNPFGRTDRARCSLILRNSANGRLLHFSFLNTGLLCQRYASYTAFNANVMAETGAVLVSSLPWVKATISATTIDIYMSPDGEAWQLITSETIATYLLAVNQVGWGNITFGGQVSDMLQSFQVV